jgi:hypothetical protein
MTGTVDESDSVLPLALLRRSMWPPYLFHE